MPDGGKNRRLGTDPFLEEFDELRLRLPTAASLVLCLHLTVFHRQDRLDAKNGSDESAGAPDPAALL